MMRSLALVGFLLAMAPLMDAATTVRLETRAGSAALDSTPIMDGHNDLPWNIRAIEGNRLGNFNFSTHLNETANWNCSSCFTDIPRLREGKVGAQFWVAYVSCRSQYKDAVEQTLEQIDVIKRLIKAYPNDLQFADSAAGIENAIANKKIASLICVEGGHSIDSRLSVLRLMYEMGARYMTLTHSCNTPWADGSPEDIPGTIPEHDGLTPWGKLVIQELNRLGMMVDLSHVSAKTMKDALSETVAPVIFSHSSAWEVCNHHRNVKDDVLKMVTENKGLVMVNFYSGFVQCNASRKATIEDVVAHINHIRTVAGVDHVGIGGDFDGVDEMPEGLEDVSKYPDLFDRLANTQTGEPVWSDEDLQKLSGKNLLRVMREVERVRDSLVAKAPIDELIPVAAHSPASLGCRTDLVDTESGSVNMRPPTWSLLAIVVALLAIIYQ